MSSSGSDRNSGACWLSIDTIHQVASRLADNGVLDPSAAEVARALGVGQHVVLAVLANGSEARLRAAQQQP